MPTLTSKKLADLLAEREGLVRYEKQIIQERDFILTSTRAHVDKLDKEIERLGGNPRNQEEKVSSPPSVLTPRNDDNGSQKKRGRPKKVRTTGGKENRSKKQRKGSVASHNNSIEAWNCECGTHMPAGRARCGACRRWKGGKRQTRWTIKKDSNEDVGVMETGAGLSAMSCDSSKLLHAYNNLPPSEVVAVASDGISVLAKASASRMEIEEVMKNMVSAIHLVGLVTMKTSDDMDVASTECEDGATITDKRMRGRPKRSPAGRTMDWV